MLQIPGKIVIYKGEEHIILNWSVDSTIYNEELFKNPENIKKYKESDDCQIVKFIGEGIYTSKNDAKVVKVSEITDTGKFLPIKRTVFRALGRLNGLVDEEFLKKIDLSDRNVYYFVGVDVFNELRVADILSTTKILQEITQKRKEEIEKILA